MVLRKRKEGKKYPCFLACCDMLSCYVSVTGDYIKKKIYVYHQFRHKKSEIQLFATEWNGVRGSYKPAIGRQRLMFSLVCRN